MKLFLLLVLLTIFSTASAQKCLPDSSPMFALEKDCQCVGTEVCAKGKFCIDPKQMYGTGPITCEDYGACVIGVKSTLDKCFCNNSTQSCNKGQYCSVNGLGEPIYNNSMTCQDKPQCQTDDKKTPNKEDCLCQQKHGLIDCAKDKYCYAEKCNDKPLLSCKQSEDAKINETCACGSAGEYCEKGKYCYQEGCFKKAAHADDCKPTDDICFEVRMSCQQDFTSTKTGIMLDKCQADDEKANTWTKLTCKQSGELLSEEYSDKDCKNKSGKKTTMKQNECSMGAFLFRWSGKCGGVDLSSASSTATLLTFVLTAFITLL